MLFLAGEHRVAADLGEIALQRVEGDQRAGRLLLLAGAVRDLVDLVRQQRFGGRVLGRSVALLDYLDGRVSGHVVTLNVPFLRGFLNERGATLT